MCSYFGFVVSPLHNFIPFLLLGLGVDDMFVIVQALDYFKSSAAKSSSYKNHRFNVDEYDDMVELNKGNLCSGIHISLESKLNKNYKI